ncbi:MAG TPA: EAL domain-containing protein [Rhodospirillales bacterium]|nr:EAL domain-containing protein [Rhodospirillales bacterium]
MDEWNMADNADVAATPGAEPPGEEGLLLDYLRRIGADRKDMFAVFLHLSGLRAGNKKSHFIDIAAHSFDDVVNNNDATLFSMNSADQVLICRDVPINKVDPVIEKIRGLFSEDPLTLGESGSLDDRFTTWYDLSNPEDYRACQAAVTAWAEEEEARKRREKESRNTMGAAMSGVPLNPTNLSEIGQRLQGVRVSDLIQQQSVIEINPQAKGKVLFREYFVSMSALQQRLSPDVNILGNIWLFQYMTETIDRRVLAVLSKRDFASLPHAISINLNIRTVLAREFQSFHQNVRQYADKVVIEFQMIDIFSDLDAFTSARDTLQEQGYRVLIDGLNPLSLQYFDPGLLDTDFIKINWGVEFVGEVSGRRMTEMHDAVKNTGRSRVILARIEDEAAVKWGLSLGINRFQGRYIDTIVAAMIAKGIV